MCVVSAVGDYWQDQLPHKPYWPSVGPAINDPATILHLITRVEFDALKKDVEELKKLLLAAKRYDEAAGEPNCEMEEKIALIRKVADLVGVNVDDVFGRRG